MTNNKSKFLIFALLSVAILLSAFSVTAAGPALPSLGASGNFAVFADTGISAAGITSIVGNIGLGQGVTSTAFTGFSQTMDSSLNFATSSLVSEKMYAYDYTGIAGGGATPALVTNAAGDMQTAYNTASGTGEGTPTATELGAGDISGMTLTPGLYKWSNGLLINAGNPHNIANGDVKGVTLYCPDSSDTFIFQIAGDLTVGSNTQITLTGACQSQNIFWTVAGAYAELQSTSVFEGVILAGPSTYINLNGATLNGMALSQTAVTFTGTGGIVNSPTVPTPILTSATITSNAVSIGTLSGATLATTDSGSCSGTNNGTNACYTLNVSNVIVTNGPLPNNKYAFSLAANSTQQTTLTNYFAAKSGWIPAMQTQIGNEIIGTSPFFYLTSDGAGNYALIDGFQYALGLGSKSLVIDDNYPAGTYTYTGTVSGQTVTVILNVTKPYYEYNSAANSCTLLQLTSQGSNDYLTSDLCNAQITSPPPSNGGGGGNAYGGTYVTAPVATTPTTNPATTAAGGGAPITGAATNTPAPITGGVIGALGSPVGIIIIILVAIGLIAGVIAVMRPKIRPK